MRKFFSQSVVFAAIAALSVATAGCGYYNGLTAKREFRDANGLYQSSDYKAAAAKYEEVVALPEDVLHQFHLEPAYFFLANSYDNLYRGAKKGDAANDAFMSKAVENYKKDAEVDPDPKMKKLSLQYLVAAYGPDKLNDPVVYTTLAAFYDRQGEFDKVINALNERAQHEPNNPEAHHVIATYYWNEAYKNFKLKDADKMKYIQAGLTEVDKALELKPDYFEALTYKNLLLRSEALVEKDPARQQQLLKQADELRNKAQELQKQKQAAATTTPAAPPKR